MDETNLNPNSNSNPNPNPNPSANQSASPDKDKADPFNQYNTEFVKLDANQWLDDESRSGQFVHLEGLQFGLLAPDRQAAILGELAPDSVNNKSYTDVTFIVGPAQHSKKYVGHRVLLAMTSPVFETMFYGDMADKNKYIRVADVAPIGFENLLRFAYTDSLNLNSVEDGMLTAYAAKKYLLPQLLKECLTYIEQNMTPSSACVVFEFAQVLNSQQLILEAMNMIDRQTSLILSKKSFLSAQASTVEFIANRKYLNLTCEFTLCKALIQWSVAESRRRKFEANNWIQIRELMLEHKLLSGSRFLAMTQEQFARILIKSSTQIELSHLQEEGSSRNKEHQSTADEKDKESSSTSSSKCKPRQEDNEEKDEEKKQVQSAKCKSKVIMDTESSNCLLNELEQRSIFMNLALKKSAKLAPNLNHSQECRSSPPEYFLVNRFEHVHQSQLSLIMTNTRKIHTAASRFECLNENVFLIGLKISLRLEQASYISRTPKFECHLKFTTRPTKKSCEASYNSSKGKQSIVGTRQMSAAEICRANILGALEPTVGGAGGAAAAAAVVATPTNHQAPLLLDTLDESLHMSIPRDKDCHVRLKRPILIRLGNLNELELTFENYALDEDVVLRAYKERKSSSGSSSSSSEIVDREQVSWMFSKPTCQHQIEISELHYYY